MDFLAFWRQIEEDLGLNDRNMHRDRPYNGPPHTDTGARGATEIRGITFRDLRDCCIRAMFLSAHGLVPEALYHEAKKGEAAALSENDVYKWDLSRIDLIAVARNISIEVEKLMGIYPNIPPSIVDY